LKIELTFTGRDIEGGQAERGDSDAGLARRILEGDKNAWGKFFDRYSHWTYRFAYWHLNRNRADAEDLCSDIMLSAAKDIVRFDPNRGDLDAWMFGLARNRLSHFCRSRKIELPI